MRAPRTGLIAASLIGLLLASPSLAQSDRYELGRRLRNFEKRWDEVNDASARERAAKQVSKAVQSFFGLKLGEAGRAITWAENALESPELVEPARRWAESLAVDLDQRFLDAADARLTATVRPFYLLGEEPVGPARVRLTLMNAGQAVSPVIDEPIETLPRAIEARFDPPATGDLVLRAEILKADLVLTTIDQTVSIVERRNERLKAAREAIESLPARPEENHARVDRESAVTLLNLLESLAAGKTLETDVSAASELGELESLLSGLKEGKAYHGEHRPGSHRVTFARSNRVVPSRVYVPEGLDASKPVPLVLALHGAGGTENLFFEGYGHGAVVDLCRARGWLLVSPRVGGFAGLPPEELVEAVSAIYPVDRSRVFAIGHSMGAAVAISALSKAPDQFAGVAALGGGGFVTPSEQLKKVPVYVGVGTDDFALGTARALAGSLRQAGVRRLTFQEYPGIEHLLIVQVALPEVFAFFDAIAQGE